MRLVVLFLVATAALPTPPATAACERFLVPDAGRVVIVAKDMLMNGVPMSVRELHAKQTPNEIAKFYRTDWEARRQRVQESNEGGWRILATRDGDCFHTVQIKPGPNQGTYALLGTTLLTSNTIVRGTGFPKMGGSVVYNDMQSNDSGKMGRTLLLRNTFSARANADFYRGQMPADGWVAVSDQATDSLVGAQWVQVWRRGVAEANVVIASAQGETQVVVNVVDRP